MTCPFAFLSNLFTSPGECSYKDQPDWCHISIFSKRELMLTFAICYRPSVCRLLSETFVHPTKPVEIFGNFPSPFGTYAIRWHPRKILRRSFQGNPSVGGFQRKRVAKYSDFHLGNAVSPKRCKIGGKLVLITNRKSYMSFRLVPKSVTLNDLERRNGPYFALFYRIW